MRYLQLLLILLIAAQAFASEDLQFLSNRCYSTVTETEVTEEPGTNIVGTLPKGRTVKLTGRDSTGWLHIEYADSGLNTCPPPKGDRKVGWIAEGAVGAYTVPLTQLVKEKRVMIAGQNLNVFGDGLNYILGERVTVVNNEKDDDTAGGRLKLRKELPVNIYCIGKKKVSTSIVSAKYEWAGDARAYEEMVKTKTKLPKGDCIIVNGVIDPDGSTEPTKLPAHPYELCLKRNKKGWIYDKKDYFCVEKQGTFTENGSTYVIVKEGVKGEDGPSLTIWELYEVQDSGKLKLLGRIGSAGGA